MDTQKYCRPRANLNWNPDLSQSAPLPTPSRRQALLWGAVAFGLGSLLWILRPVLTPFLFGALIAYMLQPGFEWLVRHRTPRGLAALMVMLVFGFCRSKDVVEQPGLPRESGSGGQRIELLCCGRSAPIRALHLALCDHVHELDGAQQDACAAKVLEAEHRSSQSLDGPMVLLDDVVQVLDLSNGDGRFPFGVDAVQGRQVGWAAVDGDRVGLAVLCDGLLVK